MSSAIQHICLIGFGEVGQILADDLQDRATLSAWDTKFVDPESAPAQAVRNRSIRTGKDAVEAVQGADLIISAVTAANALDAATAALPALAAGAHYLDVNSVSPMTRMQAAHEIEKAKGRYIEAAIMSPFAPKRTASPILLGGPFAKEFLPIAHTLGFTGASVFSSEWGRASAAKLCRSVMVKGMEALLAESLLAARRYGVEDVVLASLSDIAPGADWPTLARYMISRSIEHGERRAEEMREAAKAVTLGGVAPHMSVGAEARQRWAAQFTDALEHESLIAMLDAIHARSTTPKGGTP